jgi:hypothetical protein
VSRYDPAERYESAEAGSVPLPPTAVPVVNASSDHQG